MRQIVETEIGVYQPFSLKSDMMLPFALGMFVVIIATLVSAVSLITTSSFFFTFLAVQTIPPMFERRKYGKLGKPAIALQEGMLFIALPNDLRGHMNVPLANLQEIIVYGSEKRHRYRFIHSDGSFIEAAPMWSEHIDNAIIGFLQRRVSTITKVTIKEPQSFFSYIRGEGP